MLFVACRDGEVTSADKADRTFRACRDGECHHAVFTDFRVDKTALGAIETGLHNDFGRVHDEGEFACVKVLHDLSRVHLQSVCAYERVEHEAQVFGDTVNGLWRKDGCLPFTAIVFFDEVTAVAPDPRGEVVRDIPVVLSRECKCADLGAVVEHFVAVVHLADGFNESIKCRDIVRIDVVLLENAFVGQNWADIDEPRNGIDGRVGVDMSRVPADRDESRRVNRGKPWIQSLDFTAGGEIRNPCGAELENVRGIFTRG